MGVHIVGMGFFWPILLPELFKKFRQKTLPAEYGNMGVHGNMGVQLILHINSTSECNFYITLKKLAWRSEKLLNYGALFRKNRFLYSRLRAV